MTEAATENGLSLRVLSRPWPLAAIAAAIALPERWAWVKTVHPPESYLLGDMQIYFDRGRSLFEHGATASDTFTPIGYPLFLRVVMGAGGSAMIGPAQALLGALTAGLGSLYARRLTGSAAAQAACGLALALYFPLVLYTGFVLTETLFAFLLLGFVLALASACEGGPRSAALGAVAGAALAAAIAVRPSLLALLPLLAVASVSAISRRPVRIALVVAAALLAPVALRNSIALGRPALVATNGGVNFYLAHSTCSGVETSGEGFRFVTSHYNRTHFDTPCRFDVPLYDEGTFYRAGLRELAQHPSRLGRAFGGVLEGLGVAPRRPWPNHPFWPGSMLDEEKINDFSQAYFPLLFAPALAHGGLRLRAARGRWKERLGSPRAIGWMVLASVVFVLYAYNGNPRVRVSSDPIAVALAVAALTELGRAAASRLKS